MASTSIIGIVLVKDEERFIERVLTNIIDFCDEIIVTENNSTDRTFEILQAMAAKHSKITLSRIAHPRESHKAIERYAGTDTWVFGVDGDEIYDPAGLRKMREMILAGEFSDTWSIYGNVLNCTVIDTERKTAKGYLAPPSRSMTKLYNFSLLESWTGCPERLHSGKKVFREGLHDPEERALFRLQSWEEAVFRCLHVVFMPRSGSQKPGNRRTKLNPAELESMRVALAKKAWLKALRIYLRSNWGFDWKNRKYRKGPLTEKNIDAFL